MTQIEVTFLGTTAGVPTKSRNHACIHINYRSENEFSCLWDCGEGSQRQMMSQKINFMKIHHVFITHWHADHFAGLLGLMETMNLEGRTEPLYIYGPEAEKFVSILLQLGYGKKGFDVKWRDVEYEGTDIETVLDDSEFVIQAIPVSHRIPAVAYALREKDRVKIDKAKARSLGLPEKGLVFKKLKAEGSVEFKGKTVKLKDISFTEKGKSVIYSGDTMPCETIKKLAKDSDLLIHDSTFFDSPDDFKKDYKHTTFSEVIRTATEANVKQLILTHISRRYQNEQELLEKIGPSPNIKLAKDFMKVVVK